MKTMDDITLDIESPDPVIDALAMYGPCTSHELAELSGLSREALERRLHALRRRECLIVEDGPRGYFLDGAVELLKPEVVASELTAASRTSLLDELVIRQTLGSTNDFLQQYADGRTRACLAEQQTAGRGRAGKRWISPYGVNLYLSVQRQMHQPAAAMSAVSLAVGVAVAQTLEELGVSGLGLKWPNDLWVADHKLGGILNEMKVRGQHVQALVGMGLNMQMDHQSAAMIDQPWACLKDCLPAHCSRSLVAGRCLAAILEALCRYEIEGFSAFREEWKRYDLLSGRRVWLCEAEQWQRVVAHGVAADGSLEVSGCRGRRRVYAGEASLRP